MISDILHEAGEQAPAQEVIQGLQGLEQFIQKCGINFKDTSNPTSDIIKEWLGANCEVPAPQTPDISQLDDASDPDVKGPLDMLNNADKQALAKVLKEIESGQISPETLKVIQDQFNAALATVNVNG